MAWCGCSGCGWAACVGWAGVAGAWVCCGRRLLCCGWLEWYVCVQGGGCPPSGSDLPAVLAGLPSLRPGLLALGRGCALASAGLGGGARLMRVRRVHGGCRCLLLWLRRAAV